MTTIEQDRLNEFNNFECAFCGETNAVFIDAGAGPRQRLTEDCEVCCRPNLIEITRSLDGEIMISVTQEYDA